MPLQQTSGNVTSDAYGGGTAVTPVYIEEIFSTFLYTGNGSAQTITNGIDLSTKGGMVWIKQRNQATSHRLFDTARGVQNSLASNSTAGTASFSGYLTAFNSNGFSVGSANDVNESGFPLTSWTFRKQPKFFDVVTYTGDGVNPRNIPHNLGSTPGCIIVKRTNDVSNWAVYHQSLTATKRMYLNDTTAAVTSSAFWSDTSPTSTVFTVGSASNAVGSNYVAYLFAHNAGGFGLTGTDNVISCGSFTTDGSGNATVNLGYEPQWLLTKNVGGGNWRVIDVMRGMSQTGAELLYANTADSATVVTGSNLTPPTATGFLSVGNNTSSDYIYIAIRRGPMKVPTDATKVFSPVARAGTSTATSVTTNFPVDFIISKGRNPSVGLGENWGEFDRLRGLAVLSSNNTGVEFTSPTYQLGIANFANNTGMNLSASDNDYGYINKSGYNYGTYFFQRAPSFFDEVCYTGTGSQQNLTHNLGVAPELLIVKRRSAAGTSWATWVTSLTADQSLALNTTDDKTAVFSVGFWGSTFPTASVFTVGSNVNTNSNAQTYVAYLFATCAGVSKCTAFTGNGTSQTINCGFTSGARFVMIKATSTTGNWTIFDSARGISAGGDPALYLNSTAAEVTGVDAIDADSTGFIVNQESTFNLNASGVQYLVLAIA